MSDQTQQGNATEREDGEQDRPTRESRPRGGQPVPRDGGASVWTIIPSILASAMLVVVIAWIVKVGFFTPTTTDDQPTTGGLTAPTAPNQPTAPTGAVQQQAAPLAAGPVPTTPDSGVGHYATSTVSRAPGATANFYLEPGSEQVGFIGPGKHMPRQVYVYSCPVSQPVQLMSPSPPAAVPTQQKCCCPKPPTPPTPPTPPAPPAS